MNPPDIADLYAQYPSLLASDHQITSKDDDAYNCAAWVPRDLSHWYEPGFYWPAGVPEPTGEEDIDCYVALFETWGYELCDDPRYEADYLKIAVYERNGQFGHVAKQIRGGGWSSKAGVLHDFRHESLDALVPCAMTRDARPTLYMRRADDGGDAQDLERVGLIPV